MNGLSKEKEAEGSGVFQTTHFGNSGVSLTPIVQASPTVKMSKARILKNIVVVSVGFLFLFTSFSSLSVLQSSLNKEDGLGTGGMAVIYGGLVISCMFLPPFIIGRFGCKWTIVLSMCCYILYMVANFYAIWATIVPSAVLLGLGAAPLWSAKCTYLTETGVWYARMTGATDDDVINRFFGFFFMVFQTSGVWGNLLSSFLFKREGLNETLTDEDLAKCGANFYPGQEGNNTNLDKPPMVKVYTLCGIYTGFAVLAVIIVAVGLDKITLEREEERERKFSPKLMLSTLKHLVNEKYQVLLVVLTMYSGLEQAFLTGDYTKSFVGCALGIDKIGFVIISYAAVDAICSFTFGRLVQFVGHIPFFVLAFFVHGGLMVVFLLWTPDPSREYLFYIFAGFWGMGDAVIQTQINALYGFLWTKESEAAFANYRLWESLGFIIGFVCQTFNMHTYVKIYICMAFLSVGMFLYGVVEVMYRRDEKYRAHGNTRM